MRIKLLINIVRVEIVYNIYIYFAYNSANIRSGYKERIINYSRTNFTDVVIQRTVL